MRIAKLKTWLEVKKRVLDPVANTRIILLNSPTNIQVDASVKVLESVASALDSMIIYAEKKMQLKEIGVQKALRHTKETGVAQSGELFKMRIEEDYIETSPKHTQVIKYMNYIIELGSPAIEMYYYSSNLD